MSDGSEAMSLVRTDLNKSPTIFSSRKHTEFWDGLHSVIVMEAVRRDDCHPKVCKIRSATIQYLGREENKHSLKRGVAIKNSIGQIGQHVQTNVPEHKNNNKASTPNNNRSFVLKTKKSLGRYVSLLLCMSLISQKRHQNLNQTVPEEG